MREQNGREATTTDLVRGLPTPDYLPNPAATLHERERIARLARAILSQLADDLFSAQGKKQPASPWSPRLLKLIKKQKVELQRIHNYRFRLKVIAGARRNIRRAWKLHGELAKNGQRTEIIIAAPHLQYGIQRITYRIGGEGADTPAPCGLSDLYESMEKQRITAQRALRQALRRQQTRWGQIKRTREADLMEFAQIAPAYIVTHNDENPALRFWCDVAGLKWDYFIRKLDEARLLQRSADL